MRENLQTYLNWASKTALTLVILTTLFLFWNLTTDLYDTPKFLALLIVTGILLIILAVKFTISGKVTLYRTPLDLPLLLLLAVAVISTFLSSSPYVALLGNQLKINGSLASLMVYILFYFVLVNNLKNVKEANRLFVIVNIGGVVLSVITLLAYSGVKLLPSPWVHGINFTPTGSSFSTAAILAMLLPFTVSQIINSTKLQSLIFSSIILTLLGLTIALTGSLATWVAALAGLVLTLFINRFFERINLRSLKSVEFQSRLTALIIPVATVLLITILSFIPPIDNAENPLYTQAKNFPRENQLPFTSSWKIAVSAFRDNPFWGSGPSTFLFNFTNYKSIEYNSTKYWNVRFDSAFNEYLQVLASLGGVGLVALLSATVLFISLAIKTLIHSYHFEDERTALAISGLVFFTLLALHPATLALWVFGLLILASFMTAKDPSVSSTNQHSYGTNSIKEVLLKIAGSVTSSTSSSQTFKVEALPSILLVISVAFVLFTFFFSGKFVLADFHHRNALNAVAANLGLVAYNELVMAEKLNPYNDLYRTDLAQTNFALANAIASAKGPTEASPTGSLSDQDKQNIQVLLQQSINEGRGATTLSPKSALNWEILGLLYRQIAGVAQNALIFSLDSYGKAIFQDPLNPNLRLSVGGVYYATGNYDLAIRFFTDAINLKPDFANAYYNLSVALKDKGDLNNAQAAAEKVLTLVEKDSQDYKLTFDYLEDLKKRIAAGTAKESPAQPPASQTSSSLEKKELPKVVDVGKPPEKIATPAAVKKANASPEPTPSPSPNPIP